MATASAIAPLSTPSLGITSGNRSCQDLRHARDPDFQLPLSGSPLSGSLPAERAGTRGQATRLSTPSLGITGSRLHPLGIDSCPWKIFQLPLSGSHHSALNAVKMGFVGLYFQLPLSGSHRLRDHGLLVPEPFNSLSRDHGRGREKVDGQASISFNSLSRDHENTRDAVNPLAVEVLSTPSLGITRGQVGGREGPRDVSFNSLSRDHRS
jgi:hypothetical protein